MFLFRKFNRNKNNNDTKQYNSPSAIINALSVKHESSRSTVSENTNLLPFPSALLRSSKEDPFFSFLSLYEKSELAKHPQFAQLTEYRLAAIENQQLLGKFLAHVMYGEIMAVEEMLVTASHLALQKGRVIDHSGYLIITTAWHIALYNKSRSPEHLAVWDRISKYVNNAPDHPEVAFNETQLQCALSPKKVHESCEIRAKKQKNSKALYKLMGLIDATTISSGDLRASEKCTDEITNFQAYLNQKDVLKWEEEHSCNEELVAEARRLFSIKHEYTSYNGWCSVTPKNMFIWYNVVDYIERHVTGRAQQKPEPLELRKDEKRMIAAKAWETKKMAEAIRLAFNRNMTFKACSCNIGIRIVGASIISFFLKLLFEPDHDTSVLLFCLMLIISLVPPARNVRQMWFIEDEANQYAKERGEERVMDNRGNHAALRKSCILIM